MTPAVGGHVMLGGRRILVVEDDPLIASELRDHLASWGAEVLGPVPAVHRALRALAARRPDAALLDVNLRGERSTPVAVALRRAAVPFVVLTGYAAAQLDAELRRAPVVQKPVSPHDLAQALTRLLAM